jgi:7-cyano-7-deazaguanine tRNA-ribosyltransferase
MFEITRRDGLARIGRFETRSGVLETPALLPVVNPKICTVSPRELYDVFGFRALITNSYIIRNTPDLRERALAEGLHKMLDFPGVIMTDSGTFQSHMYGEVEMTNEEIVGFQREIGTDIGTVLDVFTEPYWTREQTAASIETTLERTERACELKGDMMINGVVQGSVFPELREDCARRMASMDIDVHPIGGVVPLMEQYRYSELVEVIIASKKGLSPDRPVHLFGAGHPMLLALATLLGCDLFDSASYAKFARDDRMMFIDGTFRLQDMQSLDCNCPACRGHTLESLRKADRRVRTKLIAEHNLYQITSELALVKRYIREGRLWELVELRCRAHPALLDALRTVGMHSGFLERFDPLSREGAMFYTGPESRGRPAFARYESRLMGRYVPGSKRAVLFPDGGKPYSRAYAAEFDRARKAGYVPVVTSPFGPVPAELDEVYPIAQSLFPEISDRETEEESERITEEFLERMGFEEVITPEEIPEGSEEYDADLIRARAVARHQFGIDAADALLRGEVELVVSRKTGKIRNVVSDGEHVLSMRAADGLYTLREEGARRILSAVPAPRLRIVVSEDAVPFVSQGRNAFCQFVLGGDEGLRPMEEVIVTDGEDNFLATGRAVLTLPEIRSFRKGVAVKVRSGSGEEP